MQDHRKLRVWQKAHMLAVEIKRETRPWRRRGCGTLQTQLVRAAESIVFNIVEGAGADTPKEFGRFLSVGIRSSAEVESQLELGKDYGTLAHRDWQRLAREVIDVRRMLFGLRAKVLAGDKGDS
jgi:four helix bundle protein